MARQQIFDFDFEVIRDVVAAHHATYVRMVRGMAIDGGASIVVEAGDTTTLLDLYAMRIELTRRFGGPVEVITPTMLSARIQSAPIQPLLVNLNRRGPFANEEVSRHATPLLEAIARVGRYTSCISEEAFMADTLLQDAVVRNLRVLCRAILGITDIPGLAIVYPTLEPWYHILSEALATDYGVDWPIIWTTIQRDLPGLKVDIDRVLGAMHIPSTLH